MAVADSLTETDIRMLEQLSGIRMSFYREGLTVLVMYIPAMGVAGVKDARAEGDSQGAKQ